MLSDFLAFLGDESTGRALTILGAAIAAIAGSAWALFKHFKGRTKDAQITENVTLPLSEYKRWLLREQAQLETNSEANQHDSDRSVELQRRLNAPEESRLAAEAELQKLADTFAEHDESGEDYFAKARQAFSEGDLAQAEADLLQKQSEFEPVLRRASDLYLGLAVIAEQKADWRSAASNYSRSAVLYETEENLIRAAIFLWRSGAIGEAYMVSQKLLEKYKSKYGPRDERVAGILNNLAAQLYDMGQTEEAKSTLLQAISIRDELRLPKDSDYASALSNLGNMSLVEGDFAEAIRLHKESLEILSGLEKPNLDSHLTATNSLAEAMRLNGDFEEAEELLEKNYADSIKVYGQNHPNVARALNFLAKLQLDIGKKEAGARNLIEALTIQRSTLGDYHPNSIVIALGVIHLAEEEPELLASWNLSEINTRYRHIYDQYKDENSNEVSPDIG